MIKGTINVSYIYQPIQIFFLNLFFLANSELITNPVTSLSNNTSTTILFSLSFCFNLILTVTSLNNFSPFIFLTFTAFSFFSFLSSFFSSFNFSSLKIIFLFFYTSLPLSSPTFITLLFNISNLFKNLCVGLLYFLLFPLSFYFSFFSYFHLFYFSLLIIDLLSFFLPIFHHIFFFSIFFLVLLFSSVFLFFYYFNNRFCNFNIIALFSIIYFNNLITSSSPISLINPSPPVA